MDDDSIAPSEQSVEGGLPESGELPGNRRVPRAVIPILSGLVLVTVLAAVIVTMEIQRSAADRTEAGAPQQGGTQRSGTPHPRPSSTAAVTPGPHPSPTPAPPVVDPAPVAQAPANPAPADPSPDSPVEPALPAPPEPHQPAPAIPPAIPAPSTKPTVVSFTASNLFGIAYVCASQTKTPRIIPVHITWRTSPGTFDSVQVTASNPQSVPTIVYNQPANYSMDYQLNCDETNTILLRFRNVSDQTTARLTVTSGGDQGWVYQ